MPEMLLGENPGVFDRVLDDPFSCAKTVSRHELCAEEPSAVCVRPTNPMPQYVQLLQSQVEIGPSSCTS